MGPTDSASFTFSWLALKLLGRGLYSNPWSALSELVANGLDAGATQVLVYVHAVDKAASTVEVIDNGTGMSRSDIDTYVRVGHNKRLAPPPPDGRDAQPMGRKGIGKLAALFLSPHFYLHTRHHEGESVWELDARDGVIQDDDAPRLVSVDGTPPTPNDQEWQKFESGTRVIMEGVDLTGYGARGLQALGPRLANQFILGAETGPKILLWVHDRADTHTPDYREVQKEVAFDNFAYVLRNINRNDAHPHSFEEPTGPVRIPTRGLRGGQYFHTPEVEQIPSIVPDDEPWPSLVDKVDVENSTYLGRPFELTGWVGVHATIDSIAARKNDERFMKNRFYNPAQIRVYVRGKLATDRLLSELGLTGTFLNYIEGEISFDILDDDELPDIATANRQDFDQTDARVLLLRAIMRPIVQSLIVRRIALSNHIARRVSEEQQERESSSKQQFIGQLREDLDHYPEITRTTKDELAVVIANKIQGDVVPKSSFKVFISHSSEDRLFASFIDSLLLARGAREGEIFFTSRSGSIDLMRDERSLGEVIKRNITDDNTLVFYLTSKNFLASQFCLFEGGAGWATRAVSEYLKLNVDYDSIPRWLTNGRSEIRLLGGDDQVSLTPEIHNYLIECVLNPMIAHLNRGRVINGDDPIPLFQIRVVPSAVELARNGESPEDFFDRDIVEHWQVMVESQLETYLASYLGVT